jgi:zinc protease
VYFVQLRALPIVDIAVEFRAGTGYDAAGKEGLARLTHTLVQVGSRRFSEAEQGRRLADVGASLGETMDRDRSGYRLRTLSTERERARAVETLADMVQHPLFPEAAFARERSSLASNTREELSRPEILVQRRLFRLMYRAHPYGGIATDASINALSRSDVETFYRAHYSAARAVVTLVGDLSHGDAQDIAQALTAALPGGGADSALPPLDAGAASGAERVAHPSEQSHIAMGVPALAHGDPDYFALEVGNFILGGGGFVSRLYEEVREKRGLAYSVYSYLYPLARPGPFVVGLQTEKRQTEQALETVQAVLARFVEQGPTARELQAAKKSLTGGFPLRIDSNRDILDEVALIGFYRLPLEWLDRFVPGVSAVTAAQIRDAFARRAGPGRISTVVIGAPD